MSLFAFDISLKHISSNISSLSDHSALRHCMCDVLLYTQLCNCSIGFQDSISVF